MSKTVTVTLLMLLIAGICHAKPQKAFEHPFEDRQITVKAMTFNIRVDTFLDFFGNSWGGRKKIAAETILKNAPDVVGLQEAKYKQVRYLDESLPGYMYYSAGRSNGKKKGESCAILYRRDRFQIADWGTFWFSDKPHKPGSKGWGNIPPRICSWVYLIEKSTNEPFYVYNVHLDNLSQKSRARSVELLAKKVSERKTDDPFIIMGDFNMGIDNPAMRFLCQTGCTSSYPKVVDAWETVYPEKDKGTGTRHGFNGKVTGPRIDHIPVCETAEILEVKIDRYNVDGKYPSDHFPVLATVMFENESTEEKTYVAKDDTENAEDIH